MAAKVINCQLPLDQLVDIKAVAVSQHKGRGRSSTARRKSKVKSQKSKVLWNGLFRDFKWLLYLRRGVLVRMLK
ncbi:hypothetical protein [Nostoc sp.]|uniref:hypothetical protein n=1 Tax=Nostoc sp. TaxID=1180 RepID=UPI002FF5DFC3